MELTKLYNEIKVNKPGSFFQMVEQCYEKFGVFVLHSLLLKENSDLEEAINENSIDDEDVEIFTSFYEYFSMFSKEDMKSKITLYLNPEDVLSINLTNWKYMEFYPEDHEIYLIFHNNNKPIFHN